MKKLLFTLLAVTTLLSCSKDDVKETDPITGTFRIKSVIVNNEKLEIDSCTDDTLMKFNSENTGIYEVYGQQVQSDCGIVDTGTLSYSNTDTGYLITSSIPFLFGSLGNASSGSATLNNYTLLISYVEDGDTYEITFQKIGS
tara:strand:- start:25070 stop:25495 length:426 start_codon:yes stop_codon:yes gene_type:complete